MRADTPATDLADLDYARSIAHEFRNRLLPLATALDALWEEFGRATPDAARRAQLRERIDRSVDRLQSFAADTVRVSAALAPEPLELLAVAREAVDATAAERNGCIQVVVEVAAAVRILGARREWVAAFVNLVRNAAQARAGTGTVWISNATDDLGGVHVYVDDDGPGVPEELREQIFSLGHSTRGGTGLGLAEARRTAQRADGQLLCEPSPRGGARFHFRLPRRSLG